LKSRCLQEVKTNAQTENIAIEINREDQNTSSSGTLSFGKYILTFEEALQKIPLDGEAMFRLYYSAKN
jgi:hypothetical protein